MRIALCLSNLRQRLLNDKKVVPLEIAERIHTLTGCKKKVARLLGFVGDAENFTDQYEQLMDEEFKKKSPEQLRNDVLALYTVDAMVEEIRREVNKEAEELEKQGKKQVKKNKKSQDSGESTIPFRIIQSYFYDNFPAQAPEYLGAMYDESMKFLTPKGARFLLYHFGYLK
jgi:hypothetical protein